jgi:hypothetical protein
VVAPPVEVKRSEVEPNEKESNGSANGGGRLTPSVVARELARVSAQLRANGSEAEAAEDMVADTVRQTDQELKTEPEISVPDVRPPSEPIEEPEDTTFIPEPEPTLEPETPEEPEPEQAAPEVEEEPEPQFGRGRRYKGAALKKEKAAMGENSDGANSEPADETEPEPKPEPAAAEEAAFGRVKRKRTRK